MNRTRRRATARLGHHVVAGALAAVAAMGATPAVADLTHLKLAGIEGEATHKDHKGEIEVLSWSWGLSRPEKKRLQPACSHLLTITKLVDKTTPPMIASAALNAPIAEATLSVRENQEGSQVYMVIRLSGVSVMTLQPGGSYGGEQSLEAVTLGFTSGSISYKPQRPDGSPGGEVVAALPALCS